MKPDLVATRTLLREGRTSAAEQIEKSIDAAKNPACKYAFSQTFFEEARLAACSIPADLPLAGLAVSVKDLFDMQGCVSAASSQVLQNTPPAQQDSVAVARLRAAGANVIGRTHMVEFAFSGVGINPHFGTPAAIDALYGESIQALEPPLVPGGSSSGAAVSVASGACWLALGSDTGGSIRIPAAFNGLVGFKPTARLVPLQGTVPLSPSLDTACAITRSARDAVIAHSILSGQTPRLGLHNLRGAKLAVPKAVFLDDLAPEIAKTFERSLSRLSAAGAHIAYIDLPETRALAQINASGGLTAAESYAWHRHLLSTHSDQYDPRVLSRIQRGAQLSAADYLDIVQQRKDWQLRMASAMQGFDAMLSPTTPIHAPTIAELAPATGEDPALDQQRDAAFTRANMLLLRNTSVVNQLDGCAITLPNYLPGELPGGLMLWHGAMQDERILDLALQAESLLLMH